MIWKEFFIIPDDGYDVKTKTIFSY